MIFLILIPSFVFSCELGCVLECQGEGTSKTCWDRCGCPIRQDYFDFEVNGSLHYFPKLKLSEMDWVQKTFGCDGTQALACVKNSENPLSCLETVGCGDLVMRPKLQTSNRMISLFFDVLIFLVIFGSFYVAIWKHFNKGEANILGYRSIKNKL